MRNCGYKMCTLPVFGTDKKTGIGYCKNHQFARTDLDRRTALKKHLDKQKEAEKVSPFKQSIINRRDAELLQQWFEFHMEHSEMKCENCGADLSHYNEKDWRGSQHHVIEKSGVNGCPSVAANILNHGVLGKWCCHSQWHTSYANAQKMPFFEIAVKRFLTFESFIVDNERKKIPECFQKALIEFQNEIMNTVIK